MPVHPPRIPKGEVVHDRGQGDGSHLDGKLHMISGDAVGEQRRETLSTLIAAEDRLALVAP